MNKANLLATTGFLFLKITILYICATINETKTNIIPGFLLPTVQEVHAYTNIQVCGMW